MKSIKGFKKWVSRAVPVSALVVGAAASLAGLTLHADETAAPNVRTVDGKVSRLTTAPKGEVDGALLEDGTVLHWPPHLQDEFRKVITVGSSVRVTGKDQTHPRGDVKFEVETITNTETNASAKNPKFGEAPPKGGPGHRPPERGETRNVEGIVARVTKAPKGEIDGVILDNGEWLHWPPHLGDRFGRLANKGEKVRAVGATETGPRGDTHFEVSQLTNVSSNTTEKNGEFDTGPHARGRAERHEMEAVRGVIARMTTAPRGEVDGAVLEDGTRLHWPPHLQKEFTAILKAGDSVSVIGMLKGGPKGDSQIEVSSVTNTETRKSVENPDLPDRRIGKPALDPDKNDRSEQLQRLQRQVEDLQREIERLKKE